MEEDTLPQGASAVAFIFSLVLVVTVGSVAQLYAFLPGLYLTEWLLILGPPLVLLKRRKADVKECLSLRRLTAKHVSLGVLAGLGVYFLAVETALFMEGILGPYPQLEFIEEAFSDDMAQFHSVGLSHGLLSRVLRGSLV